MKPKIDEGYSLFGIEALRQRVPALTAQIEGVRAAEDIEAIHQMRVATRRLRSALTLFEECLPRKRFDDWETGIKDITRVLGAARDTDVQIEVLEHFLSGVTESKLQVGIKRLLLRLTQTRAQLQIKVIKALDELQAGGIIEEMNQTLYERLVQARLDQIDSPSPDLYRRAAAAINLRLEEFLAYDVYVHQPDRVTELHAMRIAAKRLRYTMEVFASLYEDNLKESLKAVKDAQEILGDIHDCDVWVQFLPQFLEEERARTLEYFGHARSAQRFTLGILLLQQDRQQVRNQRYEDFVKFWERSQDKNVWNSLRETMQMQVVEVIELGPPEADDSLEQPEIPSAPEPESTSSET